MKVVFSMNYDDVCLTLENYPHSSRFEDDKINFLMEILKIVIV